ncbi:MAG: hypothetical protein LWX08_09700 [Deltaproteobacteria bacterium]|nr:hypothetical protein [Deltaproteobacteria bacterium]
MKKNKIYWAGLKIVALILLFVVSSLGIGLQSARAEYYADNFDDNVKGDEWCLIEYFPGSATLEENNSRLEFTADAGVLEGADYVLCGKLLNTSQNFSCKVDWHLSKASGVGTFAVCLGLVVPSGDEDIVIGAGYFDGNLYFNCFSEAADIDYTLSRSATDGVVYISYDAIQDKLYLSINGFWLDENQAAGDWAFQGLLQGAWANKSLFAYLEGDTEEAEAIEVGDAWFDNFEINFNTPSTTRSVAIDIKPGSDPNSINLGSNGLIPVAILSSQDFDATNVDPDTVMLAGAGLEVRGKGNKYMAHEEDVNGDGLLDLVMQVGTANLDLGSFQDGYAILTGETFDNVSFEGEDKINIVPPEK